MNCSSLAILLLSLGCLLSIAPVLGKPAEEEADGEEEEEGGDEEEEGKSLKMHLVSQDMISTCSKDSCSPLMCFQSSVMFGQYVDLQVV